MENNFKIVPRFFTTCTGHMFANYFINIQSDCTCTAMAYCNFMFSLIKHERFVMIVVGLVILRYGRGSSWTATGFTARFPSPSSLPYGFREKKQIHPHIIAQDVKSKSTPFVHIVSNEYAHNQNQTVFFFFSNVSTSYVCFSNQLYLNFFLFSLQKLPVFNLVFGDEQRRFTRNRTEKKTKSLKINSGLRKQRRELKLHSIIDSM